MQEEEREEKKSEKKDFPTTSEEAKVNDENASTSPLPEVKNKWILAFSVITFDLELGQKLEFMYPKLDFCDEEISNICFSSFPDSNSGLAERDTIFAFRHKRKENRKTKPSFFYGYVFFRQEKNANIHRGYLQKSVVILSKHPYFALFKTMIELIGPLFFEYGNPLLEACFQNTSIWPDPLTGKTFELPILGNILSFYIPFNSGIHIIDPQVPEKRIISPFAPKEQLVSNSQSIDLWKCFKHVVDKLWALWELVLTGDPILVLTHSPPQSSDAVLGLVSLISPLVYGGDFRPYFTIYDSDFKIYTSNNHKNLPSVILGVTNPYFCKALEHWPNILKVGEPLEAKRSNARKNSLTGDVKEELRSKYQRLCGFDKSTIIDQLTESDETNNQILRKHFLQLTEDFLIPLERYFTSLMPLVKNISILRKPPKLKIFDEQEFLNAISSQKRGLLGGKKKDEVELYSRFIRSPNFKLWFNNKRKQAINILNENYQNTILQSDMKQLLKDRSEVEVVDVYMRVQEQMEIMISKNQGSKEILSSLEQHLEEILSCMPQDLQDSIRYQTSLNAKDLNQDAK